MPLHILRASEPVVINNVIVALYGDPGAGKTSLAFTAHDPLLLDFDQGAHRSGFRRDSVPCDTWAKVEGMTEKDLEPYRTIIVDTVGRALDAMAVSIIAGNPKRNAGGGQLDLKGFGMLKGQFAAWLRTITSFGKDVILIAHGVESKKGDDKILRPDMQGSSYGEVMKRADGVAYLCMRDRVRVLSWDPTEGAIGKNPAALDEMTVPNLANAPAFMGECLDSIKSRIGQISAEGIAIRELVEKWRAEIDKASTPEEATALVADVNAIEGAAKVQVKHLLGSRAKALGYTWNGSAFVPREAKPADAPPAPAAPEHPAAGLKDDPIPAKAEKGAKGKGQGSLLGAA